MMMTMTLREQKRNALQHNTTQHNRYWPEKTGITVRIPQKRVFLKKCQVKRCHAEREI